MMRPVDSKTPPVISGFIFLGILPGLLAWFDIATFNSVKLIGASAFMTQAWVWAALFLQLLFIIDFRSSGQRFYTVSRLDFLWVFLLLLQAFILGQVTAVNPDTANLHLLRIVLALATGVAAYYAMGLYGRRFLWPTYAALVFGMAFTIPALLYLLYFVPEIRILSGVGLGWQIPGYGPIRVYGAGLEAALVVGVALLAHSDERRLWVKTALLGAVLALWAILVWSGARGGLLSVGGAMIMVSAIRPDMALRLWGVVIVTGFAGAALSLLIWLPDSVSFGFWNMVARSAGESAGQISSGRGVMWAYALDLIMDNPWFGHGLSQFHNLWPEYILANKKYNFSDWFLLYLHVHNVVLGAFLALGFTGGTVFIVLSLRAVAKAVYRVHHAVGPMQVPALLGLLTLLIHSFFTGIYVFSQTVLLLGLFFGICLAPNPAQNGNTNR